MKENKLIVMSEGFTPKPFHNLTDDEIFDVFEESGLDIPFDEDLNSLIEQWEQGFMLINTELAKSLPNVLT